MRALFRNTACLLGLVLALCLPVSAAVTPAAVSLPVIQKGETGYIEAEDGSGQVAGMVLAGSRHTAELHLTFPEPGTYQYEVFQTKTLNENAVLDPTTYQLTVYVENDQDGKLKSTVVIADESGHKVEALSFDNRLKEEKDAKAKVAASGQPEDHTWTSGSQSAGGADGSGASGKTSGYPTGDRTEVPALVLAGCALLILLLLPVLIRACKKRGGGRKA